MSLNERIKYAEMKARHGHLLLPWYKKWWGVGLLVAGGLFLISTVVAAAYVVNQTQLILSGQTLMITAAQRQTYLNEINGDGTNYYTGTTSPQVTIVEFGDFACPFCLKSYTVIKQLIQKYPDKIKVVWRDYLRNQDSIDLAMSARCAGEQGKFWEMHDALYANQANLTTADDGRPARLVALAQGLNLDVTKFTDCLSSQKYLDQIKKDYDDGNALQIVGTPTWFVNNFSFAGYVPLDKFESLVGGLIK
jgi:protein-disulfide isomerase